MYLIQVLVSFLLPFTSLRTSLSLHLMPSSSPLSIFVLTDAVLLPRLIPISISPHLYWHIFNSPFPPNCVYLTVCHLTIFIIFSSCFSSSIHASPHRLSSLMLRLFFLLLVTVIYPTITVFLSVGILYKLTHTRFSVNIH